MKIFAKDVIPKLSQLQDREKMRGPIHEEEFEEGDLSSLNDSGEDTKIEKWYHEHGDPTRLRMVSEDGKLLDIYITFDGKVAVEPVQLQVIYNPTLVKKYDSWEEVQQAVEQVAPGSNPYKAINAEVRKVIGAAIDEDCP